MNALIAELEKELKGKEIVKQLQYLTERFPGEITFSSSFGLEDQALTHFIASNNLAIKIFTLDTARMFTETYSTWSRTVEKYHLAIAAFYPEAHTLQDFVTEKGPNSFYESVENRKECCHIRKVEPLNRALKNTKVWITGVRAEQSANRQKMQLVEWDEHYQLIKYNPLLNWSLHQLEQFISEHQIPVNTLHKKGFPSIGCAPCTRAILSGEDIRAGRWWWESSNKECGLHEGR